MRKLISSLLFLCICYPAILAQAAPEYVSIVELREEVAGGWHQTYETHGRTITVDLDYISIPAVEAFPVMSVEAGSAVDSAVLSGYSVMQNQPNALQYSTGNPFGEGITEKSDRVGTKQNLLYTSSDADWDAVAEDCPMSLGDAMALCQSEIATCFGSPFAEGITLSHAAVHGRIYQYNKATGEYGQPLTSVGQYELYLRQNLQGIPVLLSRGGDFMATPAGVQSERMVELGSGITFWAKTPSDFSLFAAFVQEKEIEASDVPLVSFADAKCALEAMIESGKLRSIRSLSLGYVLYFDPARDDICWAVPTWVCRGDVFEDETAEAPSLAMGDGIVETYPMEKNLLLPAQHAQVIDPFSTSPTRRNAPKILTWDSVR